MRLARLKQVEVLVEWLLLVEEVHPLQPGLNSLTLEQICFLGGPLAVYLSVLVVKRLVKTLLVLIRVKFGEIHLVNVQLY